MKKLNKVKLNNAPGIAQFAECMEDLRVFSVFQQSELLQRATKIGKLG